VRRREAQAKKQPNSPKKKKKNRRDAVKMFLATLTCVGAVATPASAAFIEVYRADHAQPPVDTCLTVIDKVVKLKHEAPQLAHKYVLTHGVGLPALAPPNWKHECGVDPIVLLSKP
jgi:hypothetical protein